MLPSASAAFNVRFSGEKAILKKLMVSPRVICFGEALLDRIVGPSQTIDSSQALSYPGGAPANVACGLAKLGTPSAFLGCISSDGPGQQLVEHLNQAGVDMDAVVRCDNAGTRIVEVRLEQGERQFLGFGGEGTERFADAQFKADDLSDKLFVEADYLVIGSNALANAESAEALQHSIELANEYFLKILLDVNWRPMFWANPEEAKVKVAALAQQVDFLKLSTSEAEWLYGKSQPKRILAQAEQLEGVFVTAGAAGTSYAFSAGPEGQVPAFCMAVQDTTGAGDAFVAGLIHQFAGHSTQALADESFVAEAVRYGNAAGSLVTTGWGAIAPQASDAEIQAFLVGRTM